jgi:hypothetical protein
LFYNTLVVNNEHLICPWLAEAELWQYGGSGAYTPEQPGTAHSGAILLRVSKPLGPAAAAAAAEGGGK